MGSSTTTNKIKSGTGTVTQWLAEQQSVVEVLVPALTFLLGLQVLRVLVPGLTWLLGDRFGLGAVELGAVALGIFSISFLSSSLRRLLGSRWAIVVTAGGLGLLRLLMQFGWSEPLIDLTLAMAGTAFFVLFLPAYLDGARIRGSRAVGHFALGLLAGLTLDTAIHGAFATYDIAWQQNLPALLLTILTVLIQWLLLAGSSTTRQPANTEEDAEPGMKPLPWLAIGPFLFLQLVVFSNMARMAALTGWPLPFDFAWTLLAQLTALVVAAWLLSMKLRYPWLIALVSGGILVAVSVFPYAQEAWLVALTLFVGQVSLSTLMLIVIAGTVSQNSGARFSSVTVANGAGMLLLVVFLLGYYAVYQISLPYSNTILELVAAVAVAACGLASCRTIKECSAPGHAVWVAPLLALFLLILPMTGILTWQKAETTTGDGFPVRIMTYNLHNGFNTNGHLDMETLAQVIEESQPDIVVLQEISRGWVISGRLDMLTWLSQRLNMPYVSGPTADPLWGNAILSRYPIIESSNLELPPRDLFILRGFTSAVVDLGNGDSLQVIATHFHHLEQDSDVRQLQTPVIVDFWNNTERTVILGDLNAEPDAPEIDLLRKAGLVDAMADAEPVSAYTFHSADLYQRIDYIWVSPDLVVKEGNVPFSNASDHLPVVVLIDK